MADTLRINEIFYSIQGESTFAGRPCVFVRLTGCHLRCAYCDTEYSFKEGQTRSIEDVVEEVLSYPTDLVEITGGEPLLQERVHDLMTRLCDADKTVLLETSGACDISPCDERVIRIMDIKTPGSGEVYRMDWANIERLRASDEVKFVITDRRDYDFARAIMEEHDLPARVRAALFSPVFEQPTGLEIAGMQGLPLETLSSWMLADGVRAVLQPQLHKFIWHPRTRGV
jgi:7-carboxy-7-deazaguanine synthase